MKIRYIIILLACTLCLSGLAQKRDKSTVIEFRLKKQTYMAQKAGLTEEESQKFFPLYFEFQDKKKEINKQAWSIAKKGKAPETTNQEYEEIIDNFFDNQEAIIELEKEYIKKYREILSDKKIYMVYWAEIKFSRNMMKILQEMDDKKK